MHPRLNFDHCGFIKRHYIGYTWAVGRWPGIIARCWFQYHSIARTGSQGANRLYTGRSSMCVQQSVFVWSQRHGTAGTDDGKGLLSMPHWTPCQSRHSYLVQLVGWPCNAPCRLPGIIDPTSFALWQICTTPATCPSSQKIWLSSPKLSPSHHAPSQT